MRKLYVLSLMVCLFFLQTSKICAQNIGIGTTTPSANAILHLENGVSNLGLLLPNLDHTTFTPLASDAGLLVFDNVLNEVFYWDGTSWFPAGGTVSLQAAYDGGQLVNMGSGNIDFQSSAANPLLYLDEGNERIGIGTNSPSQDLDVNGIVNAQNGLYLDGNRAIVNDGFGRTEFFTPNGLTELLELNGFDITFQVVPVRINQRLAIGNIPSVSINPNAALELVENNQGLRFNRVDTSSFTGILNSTDIGLTVYDSLENELFIWNGTNWETTINSGASGWELTGNAGTLDGTDFIGTSDNIPLSFRVNNQAAGRIESGLGANTFYGFNAGQSANNNINATAFGSAALISLTSGDANSAFGRGAMNLMSTGTGNVALGFNSLFSSTNGVDNVAVGFNAMSTSSGDRNTSIGTFSMQSMSGFNNVALGYGALRAAGTESNNVAVGFQALSLSTGGGGNTALGVNAGAANITGTGNTFIGQNADAASGALVNATAIGNGAIVSANNSLVLGNSANVGIGISNPAHTLDISGGNVNIDLTHAYLQNGAHLISVSPANYNLRIGTNAGQAITTGDENITMGLNAGLSIADGGSNIAIGYEALRNTTSGNGNIAIGRLGGISNISGSGNIGVGGESNHNVLSGSNNVAVGTDAQYQNSTGNLNTAIGAGSGVISNNLNNTTAIGGFARVDSDNSLVLGSINGVGAGTADVSVGIGTPTPNQNASLDLGHDDRGLQLNRVDASTILGLGALDEGLIYYDSPANQILYWNGSDFDTLGNSSAGGEPVGTIMAFAGGAIPPGYLACDGALISRTTYADLFTAIGTAWGTTNASNFRVPDLRGKFMRGVSGGSGFDPDAASRIAQYTGGNGGNAVGSYQLDAFQGHWHQSYRDPGAGGLGSLGSAFSDGLGIGTSSIDHTREPKSDGTNGAPRTGAETRPVNLYVNYIIKYQPGATAGGGGGTVTSITAGIGLTGGTITSTGTIGLDNSGVTAGTYGSSSQSPQITVDAFGRVTAVSNQAIISATSSWDILGNAGTIDGTNFVGTTDNIPLNFRVNNTPAGRIDHIQFNAAFGRSTLQSNTTGVHNTAVGNNAMIVNSTGARNAAFGSQALQNGNSNDNTAIGFRSLMAAFGGSNTALGYQTGNTITSGSFNTFIGYDADATLNNLTNATAIGANASVAVSNALVLGNNANVGIGTSSPNAPLQFATALANRKIVLFEGANNDHQYFGFGVNGAALRYQVNGTFASHVFYASVNTTTSNELMRIVGDGNVGIGVTAPQERLHISSGAGSTGMVITNDFLGTTATDGLLIGISGSNTATINNRENGSLLIGTNGLPNINQLVLDPSGNVGIDVTPPTERLHINGNLRFSGAIMPNNDPGAAGDVLTSAGPGAPPTWTSGTGFTVAGNGLSSSGNTVDLGGTLNQNTNIDRNDYAFTVGTNNTITGPQNGELIFGYDNTVSGFGGIAIGTGNTVGGNRGIAIGNYAEANHLGSFVMGDWSGSAPGLTASSTTDQFTARFNAGYRFYATSDPISNPNTGMFINNAGFVGIGTNNPGNNQLSVVTQSTNGAAGYFENNIGSGIDGSALRVLNSGVRSIGHNAALIQNLVTKVGGSNSTKIGLKIESTGAWGVATVNQPNIGLDVTVSGADDNYAAIFNGGNVGIGTNAPTYKLTVEGDHIGLSNGWGIVTKNFAGTYEGFLWGRFGGTDATLMNVGTGGLFIRDNVGSSNFMVIDGVNGNVGIGTSSPAYTLDINGGAGVRIEPQTGGDNWLSFVNSNDGNLAWGINDGWTVNRDFRLYRYNNIGTFLDQPLTVQNSTGNVGINIINPTFKLHVNGSVAGVGAYNNLSDKRFKKSVKPISDPLQKVLALEGISFEWDNTLNPTLEIDDKRHLGFLAQDVEKILPLVVNTSIDTLNTKTVEYSSMVPVLVEAIKEQQAIIEYQKSLIETLQVQNTESLKSDENVQNKLNLLQTQIDQLNAILSMEAKK